MVSENVFLVGGRKKKSNPHKRAIFKPEKKKKISFNATQGDTLSLASSPKLCF